MKYGTIGRPVVASAIALCGVMAAQVGTAADQEPRGTHSHRVAVDGSFVHAPGTAGCARSAICQAHALPTVLEFGGMRTRITTSPGGDLAADRIVATNTGSQPVRISGFGLPEPVALGRFDGAAAPCAAGETLDGLVEVQADGNWHSHPLAVACGASINVR